MSDSWHQGLTTMGDMMRPGWFRLTLCGCFRWRGNFARFEIDSNLILLALFNRWRGLQGFFFGAVRFGGRGMRWHNCRMMDKPPQIDLDIVARYVVPGVVGGVVALILAAQELEDAARPWSWRYVTMAAGAGVMLGLMVKGVSEALGWPQALDAPLGGVAGAIGIRGLGICARWLRGRLEAVLSAMWDRSPLARGASDRKGGDDAQS